VPTGTASRYLLTVTFPSGPLAGDLRDLSEMPVGK
jgi:hypothetical protein